MFTGGMEKDGCMMVQEGMERGGWCVCVMDGAWRDGSMDGVG